jgi:predicted nucleotidyltransferase
MQIIEKHIDQLNAACEKSQVKELFVFGSVLTEKFSPKSDIDFLVDFEELSPLDYADNYFNLKFTLEEIFGRKIDLLEAKALNKPYVKKSIDRTKQLVYARRSPAMA